MWGWPLDLTIQALIGRFMTIFAGGNRVGVDTDSLSSDDYQRGGIQLEKFGVVPKLKPVATPVH